MHILTDDDLVDLPRLKTRPRRLQVYRAGELDVHAGKLADMAGKYEGARVHTQPATSAYQPRRGRLLLAVLLLAYILMMLVLSVGYCGRALRQDAREGVQAAPHATLPARSGPL